MKAPQLVCRSLSKPDYFEMRTISQLGAITLKTFPGEDVLKKQSVWLL